LPSFTFINVCLFCPKAEWYEAVLKRDGTGVRRKDRCRGNTVVMAPFILPGQRVDQALEMSGFTHW